MKKPCRHWHPTGWSSAHVIEWTLDLPDGGRAIAHRGVRSKFWYPAVGKYWRIPGRKFKTADACQLFCEKELHARLMACLTMLDSHAA